MLQVIQFLTVIDPNDYLFTAADTWHQEEYLLITSINAGIYVLYIMKFVFNFFFFEKRLIKGFIFKKKVYTQKQGAQPVNYSFYFLVQNKIPTSSIIPYQCIVFLTINS